jgi:predicted DNA repair protein MutK
MERDKIRGAVRTDFILSGEIVVIALGTVADKPFVTQLGVLVAMSALMTVGVYGLVAAIVKLDDLGLALAKRGGGGAKLGRALLWGAPYLMKALSIAGTAAMFLVGGGIVVHGAPPVEALFATWTAAAAGVPGVGGLLGFVTGMALPGLAGMVVGAVLVGLLSVAKRLRGTRPNAGGIAH